MGVVQILDWRGRRVIVQYHENFPTSWVTYNRNQRLLNAHMPPLNDWDFFYQKFIRKQQDRLHQTRSMDDTDQLILATAEYAWYQSRRPYFLVHPKIVEVFCNSKIDSVPSKMISFPKELRPTKTTYGEACSFTVLLPVKDNTLRQSGQEVRSLFASFLNYKEGTKQLWVMADNGRTTPSPTVAGIDLPNPALAKFWWDNATENMAVEQRFSSVGNELGISHEDLLTCLRLVISICFLVNSGNPLIEPDVLNKDLDKYYRAGDEEKEKIAERAFRCRNKRGWKVGSERQFEFGIEPPEKRASQTGVGLRELSFGHIRQGHWHLVWHGKGKAKAKVIWFFPTVVRPDLPFN